jgi:hypothetical protein
VADKKVTQLDPIDVVELTDLLLIVDDPGGTPDTKKALVSQVTALAAGIPGPAGPQGPQGDPGPTGATGPTGSGATPLPFDFSTTTVEPPTSNQVRFDAAFPYTAVTRVWVRNITTGGSDVHAYLLLVPSGSTIYFQDKNDSTLFAKFTTTSATVDKTTYIELPVAWVSSGGALLNNQATMMLVVTGAAFGLAVREVPTGPVDGSNSTFTLTNPPVADTEQVFLNGLLQDARGIDYSISGASVTFLMPPLSGDRVLVTYQRT